MKRWCVHYAYDSKYGVRRSVPMYFQQALDYLEIFEDAIYISDGKVEFNRENRPGFFRKLWEGFKEFWSAD